jgi:hypothetical protein
MKFGETKPVESSLIEYQDDHSKELLHPNEYTFNLKFALQKLINETNQTIKHLEEQLKGYQQRMEELGGFKSCFLVVEESKEDTSFIGRVKPNNPWPRTVEEEICLGYYSKSRCQNCPHSLRCALF